MANEITEIRFQVGEAWMGTYSASTNYNKAAVVQDATGLSVYRSQKSGNVGHALSNTEWWKCIIDMSSIKSASDTIVALNTQINNAEATRVSAETARSQAESNRVSAEYTRNNAENTRKNNETTRQTKESQRQSAETTRQNSESTRNSNENTRKSAENTRISNENTRKSNETLRNSAESSRAAAENSRQAAEAQRIITAQQAANVDAYLTSQDGVVTITVTNRNGVSNTKEVGFRIFKTYETVAAMNADAANVDEGRFVMVAGDVEDPDTGKLYVKGASAFSFICDLSGAKGIKGDPFTYADFTEAQIEGLKKPAYDAAEDVLDALGTSSSPASANTMWGKYKLAEGTSSDTVGDTTRWGYYKVAEAGRNTARQTAEGSEEDSVAGDGSRWGAYKTAEAARDTARETAEGSSSSVAGDGTRWGAYKTAEAARDAVSEQDHQTAAADHIQAESDHTRYAGQVSTAQEAATNAAASAADAAADVASVNSALQTLVEDTEHIDAAVAAQVAQHTLDIADLDEKKANKDGYYNGLTAGFAENLIDTKGQGTDQEFVRRTSCGDVSISDDGSGIISEIRGKSIKWNQLIKEFSSEDYSESGQSTILSFNDGVVSVTASRSYGGVRTNLKYNTILNHVYYMSCYIKSDTSLNYVIQIDGSDVKLSEQNFQSSIFVRKARVVKCLDPRDDKYFFVWDTRSSNWSEFQVKDLQLIDLTIIFGAGNEPTTVEAFETWLAQNIGLKDYYPYDDGSIINLTASSLVTDGFNQYNPATGKVSVIKDNEYQITGTYTSVAYSDGTAITPDMDGKFTPTKDDELVVNGGNSTDTCVHLTWSGYRNGEYEEYWKNTINLPITTAKSNGTVIFPDGMKAVGNVYDSMTKNKAVKRFEIVDLGTLDWVKMSTSSSNFRVYISDIVNNYGIGDLGRGLLCSKYTTTSAGLWTNFKEKEIGASADSSSASATRYIRIKDSDYDDETAFKASVSGVYLIYELATPVEYDLDEEWNNTYKVADFGTETIEPRFDANGAPLTTALDAVIKYSDDFTRQLVQIPQKYATKQELANVESKKADKDGDEPMLTAGAARNLVGRGTVVAEYIRRTSGGSDDLGSGNATIDKIHGKTLVWNQLVASDASTVTVQSTHKYLSNIGGEKTISVSDGNAISVTGGTDMVIDLTKMFGAGNEPSTVAEFEAMFPLDYYAYNEGQLINVTAEGIVTDGFNQYNPTTGKASVLKGNEYQITGAYTSIAYSDTTAITTDSDGKFTPTKDDEIVITGGNETDTCVHLVWSGYRDGEYEPHWDSLLPLNITSLTGKLNGAGESVTIFPDGMKSAGSVYDEIKGNKAIKRVDSVDLGTLIYTYAQNNGGSFITDGAIVKFVNSANAVQHVLSSKYESVSAGSFNGEDTRRDKTFTMWGTEADHSLRFRDSTYGTDNVAFKTAMSGVILYYELAEPLEYTLDEPMSMVYRVDDFGTESITPEGVDANGVPKTAPIVYDVKYLMNAVDTIRRLDVNYANKDTVEALLTALQTAGIIGSYTMTYSTENQKYTFTITAPSVGE